MVKRKNPSDFVGILNSMWGVKKRTSSRTSKSNGKKTMKSDNKGTRFSLPGRPLLEKFFNERIIDIVQNPESYEKLGISFPSATILYGPPGCGKTYAVERLVEFLNWPCYIIDSKTIGSPYIHQTGKKINDIFHKAMGNSPSVIIIDEMEAYVSPRNDSDGDSTHHLEEVSEFLKLIPKAIEKKVLIIGMTNYLDMVDPAIRRRGRFDHLIEVSMPSEMEVKSLVKSVFKDIPLANGISFDALIKEMTGKPLSDCSYVLREACRIAAQSRKEFVDQESIDEALKSLPKTDQKEERRIGFNN